MGHARRGYVLIAVLTALTLCVALSGAFALTARRGLVQTRVSVERTQAVYLARGACVHAVKDLSVALHRRGVVSREAVDGAMTDNPGPIAGPVPTQIDGLPEFPPELANAGGLLGAIADAMAQARARQAERRNDRQPEEAPPPDPTQRVGITPTNDRQPPIRTGVGYIAVDGRNVEVALESETGKLGVNQSSRALLGALLVALGESEAEANALLNAIEDHRISLLDPRVSSRVVPSRVREEPLRGAPYTRIEELIAVPGMRTMLYERLLACLTVHNSTVVDPNYAPREVFYAIGIRDSRSLDRLLEAQRRQEGLSRERVRDIVGGASFRAVDEHLADDLLPVFTVRTRIAVGNSVGRYLIRLNVDMLGMPRMLESREGWL